jgi:hypothetical protein
VVGPGKGSRHIIRKKKKKKKKKKKVFLKGLVGMMGRDGDKN